MKKSHGALRKSATNCAVGGPIKGKGTGTSDDVPIMASNGEFMIKAKAAKVIGPEVLEALNEIADKPDEKDSKAESMREYGEGSESETHEAAEDSVEGMKCGGAVRKMAGGGYVAKEMATGVPHMEAAGYVDEAEKRAQLLAQIPTGGTGTGPTPQPDPTQSASGTELGRNLNNAINAIPAGTMARGIVSGGAKIADSLVASERVGQAAAGAVKAMPYAIPAAGAVGLGIASSQSPAPQGTPAAAVQPAGALPKTNVPQAAVPVQGGDIPTPTDVGAVPKPAFDPLAAKAERDAQTQKDIALGNQMETERKAKEAAGYAGQDQGIDTSLAIAAKVDAERARQRAENTLSSTTDNPAQRAQKEAAKQTLAALDGQQSQLANNDAAMKRGALADQTVRRQQDITAQGQAVQAGALRANQKLAQDKFVLEQAKDSRDSTSASLDHKARQQLFDAQQEMLNAGDDPVKQKAAERKLIALGNRQGKAPTFHPGSRIKNVDGSETVTPAYVFDPNTGQAQEVGAQGKSMASDPRAIAIRDNKSMTTEQKRAELQKIGY